MIKVVGIKIVDRIKEAGLTQEILSGHAAVITTRLGFHEVTDNVCSREACMILHLRDDSDESEKLIKELEQLGGIIIKQMLFDEIASASYEGEEPLALLGILVPKDTAIIRSVQKILTSYGCNISSRLGVNETMYGEPAGLIVLELTGDPEQRRLLYKDLSAVKGLMVKSISF
ncbi:MAG TPA: hypothetical protein PLV06_01715 [Bacteroidales bacterium]|nr:hypothetical protein [Bacteroidales bacterium]HPR11077.1 hypothetical protein [Bacteroidales bacterium]HRW86469.1 hypothetical protein [Bacteroidales bacterium]